MTLQRKVIKHRSKGNNKEELQDGKLPLTVI